jgi:ribonuclease P protein component
MCARSYTFSKSHRLRSKREFDEVYKLKVKDARGPIVIFSKPNGLPHPRLGLSVGRAVGTAPRRNTIKRRLREAFRLMQHDLPRGYDLLIVVRPHAPLMLAEYQRALSGAMVRLHRMWSEKESP